MLDPRLVEAISEVFEVSPAEVTPEAGHTSIAEWDSIGHLRLVLRLEEVFGLRFSTADIPGLTSAGAIQQVLNRLQGCVETAPGYPGAFGDGTA